MGIAPRPRGRPLVGPGRLLRCHGLAPNGSAARRARLPPPGDGSSSPSFSLRQAEGLSELTRRRPRLVRLPRRARLALLPRLLPRACHRAHLDREPDRLGLRGRDGRLRSPHLRRAPVGRRGARDRDRSPRRPARLLRTWPRSGDRAGGRAWDLPRARHGSPDRRLRLRRLLLQRRVRLARAHLPGAGLLDPLPPRYRAPGPGMALSAPVARASWR